MNYPIPATRRPRSTPRTAKLKSPESVNAVVKSICDIMRRSNCAGALQYVPELTWILFLVMVRVVDPANPVRSSISLRYADTDDLLIPI